MTYKHYCSLLISTAVSYDQSYVQKNGDRRKAFLHEINGPWYDDKGSGPITFHLGMDCFRDEDNVLCMAPRKYLEKIFSHYKGLWSETETCIFTS